MAHTHNANYHIMTIVRPCALHASPDLVLLCTQYCCLDSYHCLKLCCVKCYFLDFYRDKISNNHLGFQKCRKKRSVVYGWSKVYLAIIKRNLSKLADSPRLVAFFNRRFLEGYKGITKNGNTRERRGTKTVLIL